MRKFFCTMLVCCAACFGVNQASAHNVWAHAQQRTPEETLEAFYKSGAVCGAQRELMAAWFDASDTIELGVMSEFEAKINGKKLSPELFVKTYEGLQLVKAKIKSLDGKLDEFKQLLAKGRTEPNYDAQLTKILAQQRHISRVSLVGTRYSDVAGKQVEFKPPIGIVGVVDALIEDLHTLDLLVDEVVEGTRDAIPLAEKGESEIKCRN
jgi:hypothetical protein